MCVCTPFIPGISYRDGFFCQPCGEVRTIEGKKKKAYFSFPTAAAFAGRNCLEERDLPFDIFDILKGKNGKRSATVDINIGYGN